MEKKFKIFVICAVTAILVQGVITFVWLHTRPKTAYIDTESVYNNFELKKNREADLKKTQTARTALLDSLRLQLEMISMKLQSDDSNKDVALEDRFNHLRQNYFDKQKEFEEANTALADQYSGEIWTQLNTYIKAYGEQEGYQYIFGASGDGALMYADDAVNVTEEVNTYVNASYQGK